MIDITTTATIRPSVLDKTLESFCKNLFTKSVIEKHNCRLILNVDPIGEHENKKKVAAVAYKYFNNVVLNYPIDPGFTKAVIWCWSKVESDYSFHLEDDWELLIPINIDNMINILDNNLDLASLRLNKEKSTRDKFGIKEGFIYHPKISLNPTLFKGQFVKNIFSLMTTDLNPEKQLRVNKTPRGRFISSWRHGIYVKESFNKVVFDTGRKWMDKTQFKKKIGFMKWEVK